MEKIGIDVKSEVIMRAKQQTAECKVADQELTWYTES
jgi:hypothetical protein